MPYLPEQMCFSYIYSKNTLSLFRLYIYEYVYFFCIGKTSLIQGKYHPFCNVVPIYRITPSFSQALPRISLYSFFLYIYKKYTFFLFRFSPRQYSYLMCVFLYIIKHISLDSYMIFPIYIETLYLIQVMSIFSYIYCIFSIQIYYFLFSLCPILVPYIEIQYVFLIYIWYFPYSVFCIQDKRHFFFLLGWISQILY